jgi:two-component sensor histidine kinase
MIDWCIRRLGADDWFELRWVESNGPLVVSPTKTGFGSTVIERTIAQAIDATTILDYAPEGLRCTVRAPFVDRLGTLGRLNDDTQTPSEP